MSGYRGRTGPNFSEYINNLNAVPSPNDQDQFPGEDFNLDELALFTNTDFTHFDIPSLPETGSPNLNREDDSKAALPNSVENVQYEDLLAAEPGTYFANYTSPIQPAPSADTFPIAVNQSSPLESSATSPQTTPSQSSSLKRKADLAEEQSRLAAEEDKRRRNTAASARFRVKKKQREQALEHTVKEVSDKNALLEARINQLEMENKWLKNLITEKNGNQAKEDFATAYQNFRKESEEREIKGGAEIKEGVGTR